MKKKKIKEVETILKASIEEKDSEITKLEKKFEIQQKNSESIVEKVDKFESFLKSSESKYKCKDCDFASSTEQGLKSHNTKKHKSKNQTVEKLNFPKSCDLCEEELKYRREMTKHMRTHSYKYVQYQCESVIFVVEMITLWKFTLLNIIVINLNVVSVNMLQRI